MTPAPAGSMYSAKNKMELKLGDILGADILTSKGQSGAAVVGTESGRVFGVFTGVDKHTTLPDKPLGLIIKINAEVHKFLDDIN